jgi:methionine biosynthesis protein MetW
MMVTPKYHLEEIFDPQKAHPDDAHSILMRLIPERSQVLELGCASGYLSGYMEQMLGCQVTGLDLDPAATRIAASRCAEVYTVDLDTPGALEPARARAPYDVLLAAAVLEHLKCPESLLQQAHELLKPDALVIVSLPNVAYWQLRLRLLMGRFDYEDYGVLDRTHIRLYTVKSGRRLLEDQGYTIENLYVAGSALQNLLNAQARRFRRRSPHPVLPGLLGYELIFVARKRLFAV